MDRVIIADVIGGLSCVAAAGALGMYSRSIWEHMGRIERVCVASLSLLLVLMAARVFFESTVLEAVCALLMLPTIFLFLFTLRRVGEQQKHLRAELQKLKEHVAAHPGPDSGATDPKVLEVTTERILRVIQSAR